MTLYTQVHLDKGPKSTNTICGKKHKTYNTATQKKREAQQDKSREARRELVALTKHLKAVQQAQADAAGSESKRVAVLGQTPDDVLQDHYLSSTGAEDRWTMERRGLFCKER